ncbi:integrase [Gossypium australe]|uniref:Integrase n=1 Tax=Gossypium australe TaxID=47621 RepID=A0A5B6WVS9_9ROSI|nr:integrase [Gossypium australe]
MYHLDWSQEPQAPLYSEADYDCVIKYHPSKANVVVDALSQRSMFDLRVMFACLSLFEDGSLLAELQVQQVEEGKTSNFGFNNTDRSENTLM